MQPTFVSVSTSTPQLDNAEGKLTDKVATTANLFVNRCAGTMWRRPLQSTTR